jgi:DNA-binding protein YbaB
MEASSTANDALKARFGELLDEYERMRANLGAAQTRMRAVHGTSRSSDASVTVSVDFQGTLTGLELSPRAYSRYSPSLLASEILRLVGEARAQVTREVGEVMAPFLPQGVDFAALAAGQGDAAQFAVAGPLTDESFDQWRARFSGRPSMAPEE